MEAKFWYRLRRFEGMLFLPPYLVYATLTGMPHSIKCRKCGGWLLNYASCRNGLCENCVREQLRLGKYYESRWGEVVATGISSSGDYFYKPVAKRVGWGKVLDVGCGQGVILSRLKSEERELYGFDIAPAAVRIAKTMNKGGNFFAADAQNMPLKSNTFDYLICTELIEHIEGDRAVRECYRVLKPNGVALFTAPNKSGAGNGYQASHVHSFTFKSFASFLEQAGFKVVCGHKIGLYIPILSHLLEVASLAFKRNLPLAGPLNIEVPEFFATSFLIECCKPAKEGSPNVVLADEI